MAKRGRPPVDSSNIMLRLHNDYIQKIDEIRRAEDGLPSRQELIRRMIAEWIKAAEKE